MPPKDRHSQNLLTNQLHCLGIGTQETFHIINMENSCADKYFFLYLYYRIYIFSRIL